jgi:hypothetical protein
MKSTETSCLLIEERSVLILDPLITFYSARKGSIFIKLSLADDGKNFAMGCRSHCAVSITARDQLINVNGWAISANK